MTARSAGAVPQMTDCLIYLALLSFVPLVGAIYGIGNQVEQLSLIARLQDPAFAAGDFYVDAGTEFGPRYYYSHFLAWLAGFLPLPFVIHALSVLSNFALAGVSFQAVQRLLGGSVLAGLLAATFVVVNHGFSLGLAGYLRFDSFQPANLAIPLALWGMYFHLTERPYAAVPLFALSAMMHPLIGVEIALIAYAAAAVQTVLLPAEEEGRLRPIARMFGAGLLLSALIGVLYLRPMAALDGDRLGGEEFFAILAVFRAPHHYLGLEFPSWSVKPFLAFAAATVALLIVALIPADREKGAVGLAAAVAVVLLLGLASLWFVDMAHSRIWTTAQVFRLLMVVKWVGFLLLARVLADVLNDAPLPGTILAICAIVGTADAQPRVMVAALVVLAILALLAKRQGQVWSTLRIVILAGMAAFTILMTKRHGVETQWVRGLVALLLLAVLFHIPARSAARLAAVAALVLILVPLSLYRAQGMFGWAPLQAHFTLDDLTGDDADAARAARRLSPEGTLWIVPARLEIFRTLSERASVVDFTSIPFQDAKMAEWRDRIDLVYGPISGKGSAALRQMTESYRQGIDWQAVQDTYGATHALLYAETPWEGPVLYENGSYKAVELPR